MINKLANFFIWFGTLIILLGILLYYETDIIMIINEKVFAKDGITNIKNNEYSRNYDFKFVQECNDVIVDSKKDIYNIFYTGINSGAETFSFYCKYNYENCINDIKNIATDRTLLSHINNFTHPYNSFKQIETSYDSFGKITVKTRKNYTKNEINKINNELDLIYNDIVDPTKNDKENILNVHNYIIKKANYDSARIKDKIIIYKSDKAIGPLFENYAICSGYTDLMQLFLERMKIKNYRIASDAHTWNAVNLNGKWYHLDLTWDDPVTEELPELEIMDDSFFLITTNDLIKFNTGQHSFDQNIYQELKIES